VEANGRETKPFRVGSSLDVATSRFFSLFLGSTTKVEEASEIDLELASSSR
jgi:hypothetical protein